LLKGCRRGRDHMVVEFTTMVVEFTTTYAISAYNHYSVVSSNPTQARHTRYNIMQ
jgi:hypothetical protein